KLCGGFLDIVEDSSSALTSIEKKSYVERFFFGIKHRDLLLGTILVKLEVLALQIRDVSTAPVADDYRHTHQPALELNRIFVRLLLLGTASVSLPYST